MNNASEAEISTERSAYTQSKEPGPYTVPGFRQYTANLGVRDASDDFLCIVSEGDVRSDGVFTQSHFAGPSVLICRRHVGANPRALVAISKNANVGNGPPGLDDANALVAAAARELALPPSAFFLASTGVIGRRYPIDKMLAGMKGFGARLGQADFGAAARAIMTTDAFAKVSKRRAGAATIVGIAKGVGMIEPNMATLFAFFFTDAAIESDALRRTFRSTIDRTFNSLSIDTDTSTSDTALIFANGLAGAVAPSPSARSLDEVALELTQMIAIDGEGATKIIEVRVHGASDDVSAKIVAKAIVNSPLVKTAVHGADPNWGRILMAIGKCRDVRVDPDRVSIAFGDERVYPSFDRPVDLARVTRIMDAAKVVVKVDLGIANGAATVWGCDLSDGYIAINSSYST